MKTPTVLIFGALYSPESANEPATQRQGNWCLKTSRDKLLKILAEEKNR